MNIRKRITPTLLIIGLLFCSAGVHAQNGADLVPADTGVYIEINNPTALRKQWEADPLGRFIEKQIETQAQPANDVWFAIQQALGMTGPEVIDTYFGKKIVLVAPRPGDNQPTVILSRIDKDVASVAVDRLYLQPIGSAGKFKLYKSADNKGLFGITDGWLAIGGMEHSVYFNEILGGLGEGDTLANNASFKKWTGKLPKTRFATVYATGGEKDGTHAVAVSHKGKGLSLQYYGDVPNIENVASKLGTATQFDFGPLPDWTVGAVSLNFFENNPPNTEVIDAFIAPKTLKGDILPKLSAPIVLYFGAVPHDQLDPDPGIDIPVVGIAMKMSDTSVAADMDLMLNKGVMLANIAAAAWETDPVVVKQVDHTSGKFHSANFGAAMAQRAQVDALKPIGLTYGQIGDWYVVSTQEQFFRQCLTAKPNAFASAQKREGATPMMQIQLKSPEMAKQVEGLIQFVQDHDLPGVDPQQLVELGKSIELMRFFKSFDIKVYRLDDGAVDARIDVNRE